MPQIRENLFRFRLLLILMALAAFTAALFIGSTGTMTLEQAQSVNDTIASGIPRNASILTYTLAIFQNNFRIALFGFIPFLFGAAILLFIGYNTGLAISGQALLYNNLHNSNVSGFQLLFATALTPFFFWELTAYAIAMMEGILISRQIIKGNVIERLVAPGHFREGELFKALLILALTAAVLLVAAALESYLIVYGI